MWLTSTLHLLIFSRNTYMQNVNKAICYFVNHVFSYFITVLFVRFIADLSDL